MAPSNRLSRLSKSVRHLTSVINGQSELEGCDLCEFAPYTDFFSHNSLGKWTESAKKGCVYCKMVVLVTRDLKEKHGVDISDGGKHMIKFHSRGPLQTDACRCYVETEPVYDYATFARNPFAVTLIYNEIGSLRPLEGLPFDHYVSPSADSDECLNLIKHWITQCRDNHEACNKNSPSNWVPTRLVDVGNGDGGGIPKLVLRENIPHGSQFIALSHCWGKAKLLQTTTGNILSHYVALEGLPLTFAHACKLAKDLGFRYVWIDSLCIIQNDRLDWEREAASMGKVYGEAALVVAASSANDGGQGFLNPRKGHYQGHVEVPDPTSIWGRKSCTVHYRRSMGDHMSRKLPHSENGLLGSRAWTFQEQALAKRFVSFGPHELSWECRSLNDCECDYGWARREHIKPATEPEKEAYLKGNSDIEWVQLNKVSFQDKLEKSSRADLHFEWRQNIVYPYSHRQITQTLDKLAALAAIATVFHSKLGRDEEYVAGLWRGDLLRGLAWFSNVERALSTSYFPSWSWASLDAGKGTSNSFLRGGGVEFTMSWKQHTYESPCSVVDLDCVPVSTVMPFGSVKEGAFVKLKGMFSQALVEFYPKDSDSWVKQKPMNGDGSCYYVVKGMGGCGKKHPMKADVFLERAVIQATDCNKSGMTTAIRSLELSEATLPTVYTEYPAWCFLLGTYKSGLTRGSIALVLGRSLADPEQFQRLGLVELDIGYDDEATVFKEWEQRTITII